MKQKEPPSIAFHLSFKVATITNMDLELQIKSFSALYLIKAYKTLRYGFAADPPAEFNEIHKMVCDICEVTDMDGIFLSYLNLDNIKIHLERAFMDLIKVMRDEEHELFSAISNLDWRRELGLLVVNEPASDSNESVSH